MIRRVPAALAFIVLVSVIQLAPGQDNKPSQDPPKNSDSDKQSIEDVRSRVERGLSWLARNQGKNGAFGSGGAPVATTSLCGLAFLAGGHIPGRSPYGKNVKLCVDYILKNVGRTGYINEGAMRGAGGSGMHGHGYALLFLSEVYGMTDANSDQDTAKLKEAISKAVKVTEQAQAPNGGWNYEPNSSWDEGSVTVTQVQALRAARNAGISVNTKTIEKAVDYINKSTSEAGLTTYSLSSGRGDPRPTLTAAGMSVLCYLGQYDNPKIEKGLNYIMKNFKPGSGANNANTQAWGQWWFFYGNYYATAAMYQAGGKYWSEWWPAVRETIMRAQDSYGAWKNGESGQYGAAFGTGLALLVLQIPNRYLPIFQRAND